MQILISGRIHGGKHAKNANSIIIRIIKCSFTKKIGKFVAVCMLAKYS